MRAKYLSFILSLLFLSADVTGAETAGQVKGQGRFVYIQISAGNGSLQTIPCDIYIPHGKKSTAECAASLLVLPGWKFHRSRWYNETRLLAFADKYGFCCVFPEMGGSCYESEYFPETRMKWAATPGGAWVRGALIPFLQAGAGLFKPSGRNFLLGLSTGARGVALVSLQNPGVFTAGAALSGDYNQAAMPKDNLMTALYGSYAKRSARWQTTDNPYAEAAAGRWRMPIYIGHGKRDTVSPFAQSRDFAALIAVKCPSLPVVFHADETAGHDFTYWDSELSAVFTFFASQMK